MRKRVSAEEQIRAVTRHPLRRQVLEIIQAQGTSSPKQAAVELEMVSRLGVVSYHIRELEKAKLIKLVKKIHRRGAIEHIYQVHPHAQEICAAMDDLKTRLKTLT